MENVHAQKPKYKKLATPFVDLFRILTQTELSSLRESIAAHGVINPILIYQSEKHGPSLLDGINRWELAQELGKDCPIIDLGSISDEEAETRAVEANLCRRHMTPDTWKEMVVKRAERIKRVAQYRLEGQSIRAIADREEISKSQVERDLKEATVPGGTVGPKDGKSLGKDGRSRPAKKPRGHKKSSCPSEPCLPSPDDKELPTEPTLTPGVNQSAPVADDTTIIGGKLDGIVLSELDPLLPFEPPPKIHGAPVLPGLDEYREKASIFASDAVACRGRWDKALRAAVWLFEEMDALASGESGRHLRNVADRDGDPVWTESSYRKGSIQVKARTYLPLVHLIRMIRHYRPKEHICAGCKGHGCHSCRNVGFLPFGGLPPPEQALNLFALEGSPWDE